MIFYLNMTRIRINFLIETISVEKPGFINFRIDLKEFLKMFFLKIKEESKIPAYGSP